MHRGWGFSSFLKARGSGFELSFCPSDGEFAHQKNCPRILPGGGGEWSGLELTDT